MRLVQPFLDLYLSAESRKEDGGINYRDEPFPEDFAGFPAIHPNIPPFTGSDARLLFEEDFDVL
jgi:hypothetical protein